MHHCQRATARMKAQGLTVLVRTIAKLSGSVLTRSQVTLFVSVSDKTFLPARLRDLRLWARVGPAAGVAGADDLVAESRCDKRSENDEGTHCVGRKVQMDDEERETRSKTE